MQTNLRKHYNDRICDTVLRHAKNGVASGNPSRYLSMALDFIRAEFADEPKYVSMLTILMLDHFESHGLLST